MEDSLFPSGLNEVVEDDTIPRILRKNEKLDLYRKYYFPEFNQKVKCTAIEPIGRFIFYYLSNDTYQYVLPYPIDYNCYTFTTDKYHIMSRNIINDHHMYRGYQLRWWFYKHNTPRYKNFLQLLEELDDDSIYSVHGVLEKNIYVECIFTLKYKRSD